MRFNSISNTKSKFGNVKQKIKFAYFPIKVEDKIIWLEDYICIYKYLTGDLEYSGVWIVEDRKLMDNKRP